MKTNIIGTYKLGSEYVELVLCDRDGGGAFWAMHDDTKRPRIEVGEKQEHWWQVVAILTHEVYEFAFYRAGLRFCRTPDWAQDNGSYMFVMSHTDFSEANARAAHFITEALPDLARAWKKRKK